MVIPRRLFLEKGQTLKSERMKRGVAIHCGLSDAAPGVESIKSTQPASVVRMVIDWLKKVDQRSPWLLALTVSLVISIFMFREAFFNGYVLDGNWDRRDQELPFHEFARQQFQRGSFPTWNPFIFCGTSFLFSTANLSFYPPNWLAYCSSSKSLPHVLTFIVMGHMMVSGLFSYALLRSTACDRLWACVMSIAFMLSSSMVMNAATEMTYYGLVLMPAILFILGSLPSRSPAANIVLLATGYSALIVSGVVNIVIYGLAICLAYSVYSACCCRARSDLIHHSTTTAAALALGFGVTAVRTLPFFFDADFYLKQKTSFAAFLETGMTPWQTSLRLFMPHFFGDKTYPTLVIPLLQETLGRGVPGVMNNYEAFCCYVGIIPAILGLYGLVFVWDRKAVFWKLVIAATCMTIFGGPLAYVHYVLTGKTNVHFGRLAMFLPLPILMLAAMSTTRVFTGRVALRRFAIFALGLSAIVWLFSGLLLSHIESLTGVSRQEFVFATRSQHQFAITAAVACGLLGAASLRYSDRVLTSVKYGLLATAVVDSLLVASVDRNFSRPFMSPADALIVSPDAIPLPHYITKEKRFRVLALGSAVHGCAPIWLNTYNISGLDQSAPDAISSLYWYPDRPPRMEARSVWPKNEATRLRVLQLSSASRVTLDDGVIEVTEPLRRWSLLTDYRVGRSHNEELALCLSSEHDIHHRVILASEPILPVKIADRPGTVSLQQEDANELRFEVDTAVNAILLLTDTYYPGWTALVDGKQTPIIRANGAFRAVVVPQGKHSVVFQFLHPRIRIGLIISGLALLVVIVTATIAGYRQSCLLKNELGRS